MLWGRDPKAPTMEGGGSSSQPPSGWDGGAVRSALRCVLTALPATRLGCKALKIDPRINACLRTSIF